MLQPYCFNSNAQGRIKHVAQVVLVLLRAPRFTALRVFSTITQKTEKLHCFIRSGKVRLRLDVLEFLRIVSLNCSLIIGPLQNIIYFWPQISSDEPMHGLFVAWKKSSQLRIALMIANVFWAFLCTVYWRWVAVTVKCTVEVRHSKKASGKVTNNSVNKHEKVISC